jgi:hypothetical protein
LANDALAEEKCAPELKQENLSEAVILDTAVSLIIRAEECWLSQAEVSINHSEEASDYLRDNNHTH